MCSVLSDHYSRLTTTDDGRPAAGERGLTNRKKKGKLEGTIMGYIPKHALENLNEYQYKGVDK